MKDPLALLPFLGSNVLAARVRRLAAEARRQRPEQWDEWDRKMAQDLEGQKAGDWWKRLEAAFGTKPKTAAGSGLNWPDQSFAMDPRFGPVPPPNPPIAPPNLDQFSQGETDYLTICEAQTGQMVPDGVYQLGRERREEMDHLTNSLAQSLQCRGERFYFGPEWENRCTVIGLFSGTILPLPPVRRVAVFPSIAAQQRARMLRDIEHFMSCRRADECRMFTITSGPRTRQMILREETCDFHRALSKWNSSRVFRRYGLKMQWRSTEFGSVQWDIENGQANWHLHAHILVTEERPLSRRQRRHCRKALWKLFGVHWDDGGTVENIREFVKYPVKPGDLKALANQGGPGALFEFWEQTRGLHICQPLGELRKIRAERRAKARRLVRMPVPNEGTILTEKADWNAHSRPFKSQKDHLDYQRRANGNAQSAHLVPNVEPLEPDEEENGENGKDWSDQMGNGPRIKNRIIARLAPAPYGSPILEPAVVVWGFDGNLEAVLGQKMAAAIIAAHGGAWERATAARALIRACAQAARERAASESSQRSDNCPRADPWWQRELELAGVGESPPGQN